MPDVVSGGKGSRREVARDGACERIIPSDCQEARRLQDDIELALRGHGFDERELFCIRLALEEALVNAIKHGNQMDRSKKVHIQYRITSERFEVSISDEGCGFDPEDVPDPMEAENIERCSGRGLLLMRHYMTDVVFHAPGNRVRMVKLRNCTNGNGTC